MPVAGQGCGQLDWLRPRFAFIAREEDKRVEAAAVLAKQQGDLPAVGRTDEARFAQIRLGVLSDRLWLAPTETAIPRECLENPEPRSLAAPSEKTPVVVEEGQLVATGQSLDGCHDDDTAEFPMDSSGVHEAPSSSEYAMRIG